MLRTRSLVVMLAAVTAMMGAAFAVEPDEVLADAGLEARARAISQELRCVVCQNQVIDDSDAPLARDMRILVRERLVAGDSDDEVMNYLVERYGDFVLMKPPLNAETVLLWFGPFLALVAGGVIYWLFLRKGGGDPAPRPQALSDEERARLNELMADEDE
ncbi:MAG: cytochrome c-type biogenesis protein CcmH [Parvularculaceae bacterium]|nr:cytochrome c-type biogenesis protein CcmH [Parvularculaceae bacterium]